MYIAFNPISVTIIYKLYAKENKFVLFVYNYNVYSLILD